MEPTSEPFIAEIVHMEAPETSEASVDDWELLSSEPELAGSPVSEMSPFHKDVELERPVEIASHVREYDVDDGESWRAEDALDPSVAESLDLSLAAPSPLFAEAPADEVQPIGAAPSAWAHRWADWRPVHRAAEAEFAAQPVQEQQVAPSMPVVSRSFTPAALAELPAVLQAKPVVRLEAIVPTERIVWMIEGARSNRGPEPGWADRLLVDPRDLPRAGPSSTVHVAVFQTVPFFLTETDKLEAFQRYCIKQHPVKVPPFDALTVGLYPAHRQLEDLLQLPAGSISTNAGLPSQMSSSQAANYKLVVYALLPRTIGRVVAPRDQRSLRGFDFGKWLLTAEHERLLDSLGREVVRSWYSRRSVTRVVADGHTDPVGTREFNIRLGRRRAEAVVKRLKEIINDYAASVSFPAGVLDKIEYAVASYGEDRPFSRNLQALNRRVELTVYRDYRPPPQPLDQDTTLKRQADLLRRSPTRDPDTTKRLQCLLEKVRQPKVDDRYVNDTQVFLINRDNKMPGPAEWNRVRSSLLHPSLFNPQVPDEQVIKNLERLDEDIASGIAKMIQIVDYASGADHGLGLRALATAFKQFNAWVMERLKDQASIYSCYADLFL